MMSNSETNNNQTAQSDKQNTSQSSGERSRNAKPPRACQACRASKVRCDQSNPGQPCSRCEKTGKECVPADLSDKRQQGNPGPDADLDARISALADSIARARHEAGQSNSNQPHSRDMKSAVSPTTDSHTDSSASKAPSRASFASSVRVPLSSQSSSAAEFGKLPFAGAPIPGSGNNEQETAMNTAINEVIARNMDQTTVSNIFNRYVSVMAPNWPAVVFEIDTKASDIQKSSPVLLLSILDIASAGFCDLDAQRNLRRLLVQVYLHCMLRTNNYTLDLLQALLISSAWHRSIEPAQPGEQMDIYQLSHTAANMAIIMGLNRKLRGRSLGTPLPFHQRGHASLKNAALAENLVARRVWLGCYYICANTSMSLYAPNVMRWTAYMDECLEVLENSSAAVPTDKILCQHIRLQHITEEFELQLSVEEPSIPPQTKRIQKEVAHRAFKRQLEAWSEEVPTDIWNAALEISRHFANLYMYEFAMSSGGKSHSDELSTLGNSEHGPDVAVDASAFSECLTSVDNLLRVFMSLDMSAIRSLPTVYFIRLVYAVIVLVKLHFVARQVPAESGFKVPVEKLRVSQRLAQMVGMFAGWGPLWPACNLIHVLRELQTWFENNSQSRLMLHELSWLTSWSFQKKTPDEPNASSENQQNQAGISVDPVPSLSWQFPDDTSNFLHNVFDWSFSNYVPGTTTTNAEATPNSLGNAGPPTRISQQHDLPTLSGSGQRLEPKDTDMQDLGEMITMPNMPLADTGYGLGVTGGDFDFTGGFDFNQPLDPMIGGPQDQDWSFLLENDPTFPRDDSMLGVDPMSIELDRHSTSRKSRN